MNENINTVGEGLAPPAGASVTVERTTAIIGAEIRTLSVQCNTMRVQYAIEIGRRLCEAKELCKHGEWLDFLKNETEYSQPKASRLMQIFKGFAADQGNLFGAEPKYSTLNNLSVSNALRLLELPEDERESFAREVDAEHLSARDLEAKVKERTEELNARKEEAEATLKKERNSRWKAEKAREEAETAREEAENARADAEEQLRKIKAELDEIEKRPQAVVYERDEEAIAKAANDAAAADRAKHAEQEKKLKAKIAELKEQAKKNEEILRSAQNDMQKAQTDAKDAREAAAKAQQGEAEAQRLRGDIEVLRKQLSMAAPEVAEFKAAFDRAQDELVHMTDALHRIEDEEIRGKLRKACTAMLDGFMGRVTE